MFGHQTIFDRVWSPNISRLDWAFADPRHHQGYAVDRLKLGRLIDKYSSFNVSLETKIYDEHFVL